MIPSVGRIVHYILSEADVGRVKNSRLVHGPDRSGNYVAEGQIYPALIVRVWAEQPTEDTQVNLQVFLDGNDTLWVTSAGQGNDPRQWCEPPRV